MRAMPVCRAVCRTLVESAPAISNIGCNPYRRMFFSTVGEAASAKHEIFDIRLVCDKPDIVKAHFKARGMLNAESMVVTLTALNEQRVRLIQDGDKSKNLRKTLSAEIGKLMKSKVSPQDAVMLKLKQDVDFATRAAQQSDEKLFAVEAQLEDLFSGLPNLLDDRVTIGADESSNVVVSSWGDEFRKHGDDCLAHDDIAFRMGCLSTAPATLMAGARFSILTGPLAKLERALVQYFMDFHSSLGYSEISVPYIVSSSTLRGTGQLPKFEEDLFKIQNHKVAGSEDAYLIPTAEVPVTATYRDQLLSLDVLPIAHVAYTPCFRAEAGSHGRDSRGLIRQHQFHKVELVKICEPQHSNAEHLSMVTHVEDLLKSLRLPYRRMMLCSGDTGFSARLCYDLEVWMPSQRCYREISSISNCHEFQAKRLGMRFRCDSSPKSVKVYPHTLNGSGLAVGRTLAAILENFYRTETNSIDGDSDSIGCIDVPEPLWPYMKTDVLMFRYSS